MHILTDSKNEALRFQSIGNASEAAGRWAGSGGFFDCVTIALEHCSEEGGYWTVAIQERPHPDRWLA